MKRLGKYTALTLSVCLLWGFTAKGEAYASTGKKGELLDETSGTTTLDIKVNKGINISEDGKFYTTIESILKGDKSSAVNNWSLYITGDSDNKGKRDTVMDIILSSVLQVGLDSKSEASTTAVQNGVPKKILGTKEKSDVVQSNIQIIKPDDKEKKELNSKENSSKITFTVIQGEL